MGNNQSTLPERSWMDSLPPHLQLRLPSACTLAGGLLILSALLQPALSDPGAAAAVGLSSAGMGQALPVAAAASISSGTVTTLTAAIAAMLCLVLLGGITWAMVVCWRRGAAAGIAPTQASVSAQSSSGPLTHPSTKLCRRLLLAEPCCVLPVLLVQSVVACALDPCHGSWHGHSV